jgi:hypothetical protein
MRSTKRAFNAGRDSTSTSARLGGTDLTQSYDIHRATIGRLAAPPTTASPSSTEIFSRFPVEL